MSKGFKKILLVLSLLSISFVAVNLLEESGFSSTSDEGYYFHYANIVSQHGIGALPELIQTYFNSPRDQWYPPPTRVGYILVTSFLFSFFPAFFMLGLLSFGCYLFSLIVNFHFTKKYLGESIALASAAVLSSSPLLMAMSRRALTDSSINLLWCLACWLFVDFLIQRQLKTFGYFLLVFVVCLLFKESSAILLPVWFIMGWCFTWEGKPRLGLLHAISLLSAMILGFWLIPGLLVGIPLWTDVLMKTFLLQHQVFAINPYVLKYCQGSWFRYLLDSLLLAPVTFLLFVAYSGSLISRNEKYNAIYYLWGIFFISVYVFMLPLQKNIRYVIGLETVYSLFAVSCLYQYLVAYQRKYVLFVAGIMVIVVINWHSFLTIFINGQLLDPITNHLLVFRQFIPAN